MKKEKKSVKLLILTSIIHVMIFITGGFILLQLQESSETQIKKTRPAPELYSPELIKVQTSHELTNVDIQGRIQAENRVELFPEVQGKVVAGEKPFREGVYFNEGEVIFQLDDTEVRLQLYSSRSGLQTLVASLLPDIRLDYPERLNLFEQWYASLHPEETLPVIPDFDHHTMERFLTSRGVYDRYYQIKSAENRLEKFTIRAPFSGILSSARAEPRQSVGSQTHVGTFVDPGRFLLTANVRQSQLDFINIGDTADLTDQQRSGTWTATVARINPSVDPRSQTVEVYLEIRDNGIREGMYLEGSMKAGESVEVAQIPKTALLRNSCVYTLSDGVVRQLSVKVVDIEHQMVRVTGLENEVRIVRDARGTMAGQIIRERDQ